MKFYGRIGALRKLARRQIVVNRQNLQKSHEKIVENAQKQRENAIFLVNSRIFSLFWAMFGQFYCIFDVIIL